MDAQPPKASRRDGQTRSRRTPKPKGSRAEAAGKNPSRKKAARKERSRKETTFQRRRRNRLESFASNDELVADVCHLHVQGRTASEIIDAVKKLHPGVELLREDPNWLVRWAATKGYLVFRPPLHGVYRRKIRKLFPKLDEVEVVRSAHVRVIARRAARMLLAMVRKFDRSRTVVRVGLAGGHSVREVIRYLADEMVEPITHLPRVVHFHALAAGFNPEDPTTNPNYFVSFFIGKLIPCEIRFTNLSAPAIVDPDTFEHLKELEDIEIKDAFDAVRKLDILVTSGTTWHEHCILRKRMSEDDRATLERRGVEGDLLWRPFSREGPIEERTSRRAFTLVELNQLRNLIRAGKKVLVMLAPCGICRALKGSVAKFVCEQEVATHVVVDSRSAGQMLGQVRDGQMRGVAAEPATH